MAFDHQQQDLTMSEPVLFESHMHTPLCKHAVGEPEEYAQTAIRRGLKGIIITCHCPMPDGYSKDVRMEPSQFPEYLALIERAARKFEGQLEILPGLESDYLPGTESWLKELHDSTELHHVLGSVHPQIREFRHRYYNGDIEAYQRLYFDHLAEAAESGLFDTLSHPDLIKNESPADWDFPRILPHIRETLDRIAATGCAMELNTSGLQKRISEMNPGEQILEEIGERGIPVVIGADAHHPSRVAADYEIALQTLRRVGFEEISLFRNRKRYTVSIAEALASLK